MSRKTISGFHYVETITLPDFICNFNARFFHNVLINKKEFMHRIFNVAFQLAFKDGIIKKERKFDVDEFDFFDFEFSDNRGVIQLTLPTPKASDKSILYHKYYYIPYMWYEKGIRVFDLYAVETDDYCEAGVIYRFKKTDSGEVDRFPVAPMPDVKEEKLAASTVDYYAFERYIDEE